MHFLQETFAVNGLNFQTFFTCKRNILTRTIRKFIEVLSFKYPLQRVKILSTPIYKYKYHLTPSCTVPFIKTSQSSIPFQLVEEVWLFNVFKGYRREHLFWLTNC